MFSAFRRKRQPKQRVLGTCPVDGTVISTYAWMTAREMERFDRKLVLFCPLCRKAHVFDREHLTLAAAFSPGS